MIWFVTETKLSRDTLADADVHPLSCSRSLLEGREVDAAARHSWSYVVRSVSPWGFGVDRGDCGADEADGGNDDDDDDDDDEEGGWALDREDDWCDEG